MGTSTAALTALRVLGIVVALGVAVLGAWSKFIIHDIDTTGASVLNSATLESQEKKDAWQSFFKVAVGSTIKIYIAIAAASFTALTTTILLLSQPLPFLRLPTLLSLPLEILSTLSISAAFAAALSAAMSTTNYTFSSRINPSTDLPANMIMLDTSTSALLKAFSALLPLSKAFAIAAGVGAFLMICLSASTVIQTCHRARDSKPCSFEPTASALGMGHGYHAVGVPRISKGAVPTIYDPLKPDPTAQGGLGDEERGILGQGAEMGRRDSGTSSLRMEKRDMGGDERGGDISGPIGLKRPEEVAQMRPARPWSEMPKRR
ncbi:hypothetical protein CC80DRAFT_12266 [Byssothecium circinans]|uniref:Uncharacterized protein n=1 Tax=Byssothecium circinans TaxID=147558 RepID=A0A6A5UHB4_9PLEO|nr:hypothetical protein CC80DRAFT_12266 [Byssothecium circinans]